jgi:hypothetical protein
MFIFFAVLAVAPTFAQESVSDDSEKSSEQAMAVVKQMADCLSKAKQFSVNFDSGFDAVQEFGQKIEFGETRRVVLNRPDKLRIEATKRDGSKSELTFDGKEMAIYFAKENVYATDAMPGTVEQAVAHFINDLDMRLPLAELLNSNLWKVLSDQVVDSAYVEKSFIAGIPCDHVALRGDDVDLQLWVAQGDKPLPQRIVITYTRIDGRPQFWAQFSGWNLAPEISNSLFIFKAPAGAAKIAFAPKQMLEPGGQAQKEGN